jgi:hypothetical protein
VHLPASVATATRLRRAVYSLSRARQLDAWLAEGHRVIRKWRGVDRAPLPDLVAEVMAGVVGWRPGPGSLVKGVTNGAVEYAARHKSP